MRPSQSYRFLAVVCHTLAAVAVLLCPLVTSGGVGRWTYGGPGGHPGGELVVGGEGERIFLISNATTAWFSDDDGRTWSPALLPPGNNPFGPDLAYSSELLTTTARTAAWSDDGGRSWHVLEPPPGTRWGAFTRTILAHPADPDVWYGYAWSEEPYLETCDESQRWWSGLGSGPIPEPPFSLPPRLFRSRDRGRSWELASTCHAPVGQLIPILSSPNSLLVSDHDYHVMVLSNDGGRSWKALPNTLHSTSRAVEWAAVPGDDVVLLHPSGESRHLPSALFRLDADEVTGSAEVVEHVRQLAASPCDPGRVYDAVRHRDENGLRFGATELKVSDDAGATWTAVEGMPPPEVLDLAVTRSGALLAATAYGVLRSDDGGESWQSSSEGLERNPAEHVVFDETSPQVRYAVTTQPARIWRSGDGGASWDPFDGGLPERRVSWLGLRTTADLLYAFLDPWEGSGRMAVFRRGRDEDAWTQIGVVDTADLPPRDTLCPPSALSPPQPPEPRSAASAALCSEDGGHTWSRLEPPQFTSGMFFPTESPQQAFATGYQGGIKKIYRTTDGGDSWEQDFGTWTAFLAVEPGSDERAVAVAGRSDAKRLYRRFGRRDWRAVSDALPCSSYVELNRFHVAYSPVDPRWVFARICGRLLWSSDRGLTWQFGDGRFPSPSWITADPLDPRRVHAGPWSLTVTDAEPLALDGGRFEVTAAWRGPRGGRGAGRPEALTADTGYFWFFDPANVELVVKVLDGRPVNGRFWVFYGALSNVEYELTVVDTETGERTTYTNPAGHLASSADTEALPAAPVLLPAPKAPSALRAASELPTDAAPAARMGDGAVTEAPAGSLRLHGGRFEARVEWEDFRGNAGAGTAQTITSDTGYFWFFAPDNVELVVKVLDGRPVNGRWWIFGGALSNVAYRLTVTDTATGETAVYDNPSGTFASFGDTAAFPRP